MLLKRLLLTDCLFDSGNKLSSELSLLVQIGDLIHSIGIIIVVHVVIIVIIVTRAVTVATLADGLHLTGGFALVVHIWRLGRALIMGLLSLGLLGA